MPDQDLNLSEWLFHFVHPESGELLDDWEGEPLPVGLDPDLAPVWSDWDGYDEQYASRQDADWNSSPFAVLQKILHDGHIRASWMPFSGNASVFGPYPAVSLTGQFSYPNGERAYAIGVLRTELARAGGRPVIQGLLQSDEARPEDPYYGTGLRILSSAAGIGLEEQYRYVPLNGSLHQGEWRWAYRHRKCDIPGLPVWLQEPAPWFSTALILVQTRDEANRILDQLKAQSDHGVNEYNYEFHRAALRNTIVLPLCEVEPPHPFESPAVLPSISAKSVLKLTPLSAGEGTRQKVKWAMVAARQAAVEAVDAYEQGARRDQQGRIIGLWGHAKVVTYEPRTEITDALLQLGYAKTWGETEYHVHQAMNDVHYRTVDAAEAGATAAADVLTVLLGQVFDITSWAD